MAKKLYLLITLFALSIFIVIALSWVGINKLKMLEEEGQTLAENSVQATEAAGVGPVLYQIVADSIINGNLVESAKDWQEAKNQAVKYMEAMERIADTNEEKQQTKAAHQAYNSFVNIYETEMLPLVRAIPRNPAAVTAVDGRLDEESAKISDNLYKIRTSLKGRAAEDAANFNSVSRTTLTVLIVVSSSVLLVAVLFGVSIVRSILRQLGGDPKDVAQVVNTMAAGNFSTQPKLTPVAGSLLADAYHMQSRLREMIAKVKDRATQLEGMARSLAEEATKITANTNNESDAVSSMAASIEEMSVSTSHISSQGNSAKQIANDSRSSAEQGTQVVNKTVSGLLVTAEGIETASSEVSRLGEDASRIIDVAKVIKEIADQTNLLALNAAIEAARAGEQGRGFAVVADEVRKLAERTGNATSEINQMSLKISEMVNHTLGSMGRVVDTTRQGVTDAKAAQESIAGIQQSFEHVANVIDEISAAMAEQDIAAMDLAKNTERVAQMSEENSSASRSLSSLAHDLESKAAEVKGAVEIFIV